MFLNKGILTLIFCNILAKLVHVGYGVELLRIIATLPTNEEIDVFDVLVGDYISYLGRFAIETAGLYQCELICVILSR